MIAIVAILASILQPIVATSRARAGQARCASNQKQIGLAITMYTRDSDETYSPSDSGGYPKGPARQEWLNMTDPYVKSGVVGISKNPAKSAFADPDIGAPTSDLRYSGWAEARPQYSYIPNGILLAPRAYKSISHPWPAVKDAEVPTPGDIVMLARSLGNSDYTFGQDWYNTNVHLNTYMNARCRHNHGANYLFADGHLKMVPSPERLHEAEHEYRLRAMCCALEVRQRRGRVPSTFWKPLPGHARLLHISAKSIQPEGY